MTNTEPTLNVLALNSGSSSLKFGLYGVGPHRLETRLSGEAEFGGKTGTFHAKDAHGAALDADASAISNPVEAVARIASLLARHDMPAPDAVGHRIVHGGPNLSEHRLIDDTVLRKLERASAFAPLHIPPALAVIAAATERFAGLPRAACFDTVFHRDMPPVARVLPLPRTFQAQGVRRYGFHGLSCESIVRQLAGGPPSRLIIAHLGNGASVTAVRDGQSIDTSMGMTPTGGVIMGTRSGDLDPGVLIYLMREKAFDAARLEDLVDHRSGLAGISGAGGDMRGLHDAATSNADARLAIEMFCYSVRKQIAAMIAVLGGVDLIVFTGGIGENDAEVRAAICEGLSCFGLALDDARNRAADNPISDPAPRCPILVLPSQEDEQIARHTQALVRDSIPPLAAHRQ